MPDYFRSVSVRITGLTSERFYWAIVEDLGDATVFHELASAVEPVDTWEAARKADATELRRREPHLWAEPPEHERGAG